MFIINPYSFGASAPPPPPPPGFSAEYQAVLDRATVLGYAKPSSAQQTKQNQLVVDLKALGIWNLLDVFYVFATDGSSDFATLNWKAPTLHQITKVNSPVFTSNQGFAYNGTTNYLNSAFAPATQGVNYTLNNASMFVHVRVAPTTDVARVECGALLTSPVQAAQINVVNRFFTGNSDFGTAIPITDATGLFSWGRTTANNIASYRNGVAIDTQTTPSVAIPSGNILTGARMDNDTVPNIFTNSQHSMFGMGASLDTLHDDLYTAWNNYLISL